MKINRHNYEEYLILYADNELSSDERRMVEEFVSINPDLKDELEVYLSAVLLPETSVGFDNKEELEHHDESLISYLDNELTTDEKMQLEELIRTSPKLQQDLELYRKTKLQPDADIVFENKSVLYRSTERRRVVPMTIIRWSVAAAILLAISVTAVKIFNKKPDEIGLVKANPELKIPVTNVPSNNPNDKREEGIPVINNDNTIPSIIESRVQQNNIAQANIKGKSVLPNQKATPGIIKPEEKKNEIANNLQPLSNNLPTPQNNDALVVNTNQKPKDPVTIPSNDPYNNQETGSNQTTDAGPTFAKKTLPPDDGGVEEGGQNKKSRGLFRKLTRVFEKNTGIKATDDDDKLHIAAFTVKLK